MSYHHLNQPHLHEDKQVILFLSLFEQIVYTHTIQLRSKIEIQL